MLLTYTADELKSGTLPPSLRTEFWSWRFSVVIFCSRILIVSLYSMTWRCSSSDDFFVSDSCRCNFLISVASSRPFRFSNSSSLSSSETFEQTLYSVCPHWWNNHSHAPYTARSPATFCEQNRVHSLTITPKSTQKCCNNHSNAMETRVSIFFTFCIFTYRN